MRKILVFIFIVFSLTFVPKNIFAKVLPQAAKLGKTTVAKTAGSGINVAVNLRSDRRAVNVNFSNLQNAKSVSYALTYQTSDQEEGAMGAINYGSSSTAFQELLLGTCSKGVCRYHTGVKNVKLEVTYTTKEGKKYIKKYRIKV